MARKDTSAADPIVADAGLAQTKRTAPHFRQLLAAPHTHGTESVREADHNGHHIVVRTTYAVTIDGKPFDAALGVSNEGHVHYHGMPNVGFASALDLMKAVVDRFGDQLSTGSSEPVPDGDHHHEPPAGGNDGGDDDEHAGHAGHAGRGRAVSGARPVKRAARRRPAPSARQAKAATPKVSSAASAARSRGRKR